MALQTGVSTSKVLILAGAGLTGSIILRSGRLSELVAQLQELLKGVDEVEISSNKFDTAALAAQIRQLAQEIKELSLSNPITIYNGSSSSSGSYSSYLVPAAALGAMGYCYMWWKGWSFSDVMFVTRQNMANAVATVSKQLENVSETLASTKRHLSKRLENLDWKLEEQKEISEIIVNNVNEVKSNLAQIGFDVETIHRMVSGMEGKIELLEAKQDVTNSGLWHLCQLAGGLQGGQDAIKFKDASGKVANHLRVTYKENPVKGLQFISDSSEFNKIEDSITKTEKNSAEKVSGKNVPITRRRIHRSYPVGISLAQDII
ncbi:uncharacterized protein LOC116206362 [Punica granatum]|uniref:Uncharacterized protein LOC116206362 n=1 Tax=Punica granatum TaxID=22663 RepID=A0A6P8DCX3_PUNGR|nr:uncharacterized protein LOC116206362 [Punica granatum]